MKNGGPDEKLTFYVQDNNSEHAANENPDQLFALFRSPVEPVNRGCSCRSTGNIEPPQDHHDCDDPHCEPVDALSYGL